MNSTNILPGNYGSVVWPFVQECRQCPAVDFPAVLCRHALAAVGAASAAVFVAHGAGGEAVLLAIAGRSRMNGEADPLIREAMRTGESRFFGPASLPLFESAGEEIAGACVPFVTAGDRRSQVLLLEPPPGEPAFAEPERNLLLALSHAACFQVDSATPGPTACSATCGIFPVHDPEARRVRYGLAHPHAGIVGESPAAIHMLRELDLVIDCDDSVLVLGETGSGKELIARAIATGGKRSRKPYEAHNGAAIPTELFESTMFGYEKGAFNGAEKTTPGAFQRCDTGTLFLDEFADLQPDHQAKVLRVIESGEFFRVGGQHVLKVDVRVVGATCKDIEALAKERKFRDDLYFRIDDERIAVPPLRDRKIDIPLLLRYRLGARSRIFGREALATLAAYDWPGNIRELFQVANRVLRRVERRGGTTATADEVRAQIRIGRWARQQGMAPDPLRPFKSLPRAEKRRVMAQELEREGWDLGAVARNLGYRRYSLVRLLDALGIPRDLLPRGQEDRR